MEREVKLTANQEAILKILGENFAEGAFAAEVLEKVEGKTVFNGNAVNGVTVYKTLAELLGVLQVSLREQGIDFEVVSSSVWRKEIGIKGKMRSEKKQSAQKQVREWFNIDVSEDEADAICIGQYAVRKHKTVKMFQWG